MLYLRTYMWYLLPALFLVLWHYLVPGISFRMQMVLLAFALVTTGIPHGALDYLVFRQQQQRAGHRHSLVQFLVYYLGLMLFYGALWWFSPSLSLTIFLLLSAWHFADNDLSSFPLHHPVDHVLRMLLGTWLLLVLLFGSAAALLPYLQPLVGTDAFLLAFVRGYQPFAGYVFWAGIIAWPLVLALRLKGQRLQAAQWYPFITLLLLLLLCRQLPLILSFAVYFALWHSLRSFHSIAQYFREQEGWRFSYTQLIRPALPFVAGAFAALGLFFWWSHNAGSSLAPLWIFLSLITLPHGLLMHDVFDRAATTNSQGGN